MKTKIGVALAIGVACAFLTGLVLEKILLFRVFELKTLDFRFHFRGKKEIRAPMVIVGIDDKSIRRLGRWPWRRKVHAKFLRQLSSASPRMVLLDIFFSEYDREHPEDDRALFSSIRNSGNIYTDFFFSDEGIKEEKCLRRFVLKLPAEGHFSSANGVVPLLPEICSSVRFSGHAVYEPDEDDVIRRVNLGVVFNGKVYPSVSLAMAMDFLHTGKASLANDGSLLISSRVFPVDKEGKTFINFLGEAGTAPQVSYVDVLEGKVKQKDLSGKIVFVGGTAPGLYDIRPTPFGIMTGIELIANTVHTLIEGDFVKPASGAHHFFLVFLTGILCGIFSMMFSLSVCTLCVFSILAVFAFSGFFYFESQNVWFPLVPPLTSGLLAYPLVIAYRYATEEKEKRFIKDAFGHYLSKPVFDTLLKNPSRLKLGGEKKEVTVLFSDIRGFTGISEKMEPQEVVARLNEYFTAMTEVILKNSGTLDKFIGDCIMAFFGAPVEDKNHAMNAAACALEMKKALEQLNEKWKSQKKQTFSVGIGLNTGEVVVGNMGSKDLWNYTVIGDAVNLASRLEGLTKEYKTAIILSQSTYEEIQEEVDADWLGEVQVKGKEKPVGIYALKGLKG